MTNRKYYSERKDLLEPDPLDINLLKKAFNLHYKKLRNDLFFVEATGYDCVDFGVKRGKWGWGDDDYQTFLYTKLKKTKIWPIEEQIMTYSEERLFSVIEFLFDYVTKPTNKRYHDWNNCGWHATKFDQEKGQLEYLKHVNELLTNYKGGYQLTKQGEIHEIPPKGFEEILRKDFTTDEPENIDKKITIAISKFHRYGGTIADKMEAVRTLGDVLEYLRKGKIVITDTDGKLLLDIVKKINQILNKFSIRHHASGQYTDYNKDKWYPYFFYVLLASIHLLISYKKEIPMQG